ncbi:PepSY domain-containing protein [Salipiger sp.]|uniref:PepSY domain-containing protein n=1 Tax=Salipiger sp. TaxID=2078585 RepID=UPI003A96DE57
MKRFTPLTLIPVALAAGVAGAAWAGTDKTAEMSDAEEIQAVKASGMTLTQAVDAAQGQTGGIAISAGWEDNDQGSWGYEVEIADASSAMQTWFVDPASGTVTKVTETDDDGGHEQGEADDDEDND